MNYHPNKNGQKYLFELKLALFNYKYHNERHGVRRLNDRQQSQLRILRGKCLKAGYNRQQIKKILCEEI